MEYLAINLYAKSVKHSKREIELPDAGNDLSWSPSGEWLAISCVSGRVRLWNASSNQLFSSDSYHSARGGGSLPCARLAWAPDSTELASTGDDGALLLWRVNDLGISKKEVLGECLGNPVIAWTPGKKIALGWPHGLLATLDLADRPPTFFERPAPAKDDQINAVKYSPRGESIALCTNDGVRITSLEEDLDVDVVLHGYDTETKALDWSPDGARLASGQQDGSLVIWNWKTKVVVTPLVVHGGSTVSQLEWSSTGDAFVAVVGTTLHVWTRCGDQFVLGKKFHTSAAIEGGKPTPGADITAVCWSKDARFLVSGHQGGNIIRWSLASGKPILPVLDIDEGRSMGCYALAWSPVDDNCFATGGNAGGLGIWDFASGKRVRRAKGPGRERITCLAWRLDGKKLAVGDRIGALHVWNILDGRSPREVARPKYRREQIKIKGRFLGQKNGVRSIMWVKGASTFVSLSVVEEHVVISTVDGSSVFTRMIPANRCGCASIGWLSDTERFVAAAKRGGLAVWDSRTCYPLGTPVQGYKDSISILACSPDGRTLICANVDGTLNLWNLPELFLLKEEQLSLYVYHQCLVGAERLTPREQSQIRDLTGDMPEPNNLMDIIGHLPEN